MKLIVSRRLAFRVYDEFERKSIEVLPNGNLLVEADFPMNGWLVGYLLSFGTDVEVLQPAGLRQLLANYAQKIADHHKP